MIEKLEKRENIFKGKVIEVSVDTIKNKKGEYATRELVHHNGAACVLPIDEEGNVYLVKQFRYAFLEYMLEVPAGKRDGQEEFKITAIRELKEETGIVAENVVYLGEYRGNVAILTEKICMYLATNLSFEKQHLDNGEYVEIYKYPLQEVVDMVIKNKIKDGKTIANVLLAQNYLKDNNKLI